MQDYVRFMARKAIPAFTAGRGEPREHLSFEERMAVGYVPEDIEVFMTKALHVTLLVHLSVGNHF